jgi:hypothetical protein
MDENERDIRSPKRSIKTLKNYRNTIAEIAE